MSELQPEILLIEDDPQIRRFLRASLPAQGYRLREAETASEGYVQSSSHTPDLILLDLGLPDGDGLSLIPRIRAFSVAPIIVLSARGQEKDKIAALDAGADDFVSKPFAMGELQARIRAALRRAAPAPPASAMRIGEIEIDFTARRARRGGEEIHLTPIEFKLLQLFVRHAGKVITQRQLLAEVWGPQHVEEAQYLRVYVGQLRRKLEPDPARPRYLLTETGVGYRLMVECD